MTRPPRERFSVLLIRHLSSVLRRPSQMFGCLCAALACVGTLGTALARAELNEALDALPASLLDLPLLNASTSQAVVLNGQRLFLSSSQTPLSVNASVQLALAHCHGGPANASKFMLPEQHLPVQRFDGRPSFAPLTAHHVSPADDTARVACLAPTEPHAATSLWTRLRSFAATGDVSKLGDMRYVLVRRKPGMRQSQVLVVYSTGPFALRQMFPSEGDAPGSDSSLVPRPAASTRRFSAELPGTPYSYRVYTTDRAPQAVLPAYTDELTGEGFEAHESPSGPRVGTSLARAFTQRDAAVIILIQPDALGSRIHITELGTSGATPAQGELQ